MQNKLHLTELVANPQYYDYIHSLKFGEDGSVKFVDGAGQALNAVVIGKYRIIEEGESSAKVEFFDLIEINPYQDNQKIRNIESFQVKVIKENGEFPFVQEVVWKIENEDEHPCLLFEERYVFDTDPFFFARERQVQNLYYLTENKDLIESARFYYSLKDVRRLTMKGILSLGISEKELWKPWQSDSSSKNAS